MCAVKGCRDHYLGTGGDESYAVWYLDGCGNDMWRAGVRQYVCVLCIIVWSFNPHNSSP